MKALVSGQAGLAVVVESSGTARIISLDEKEMLFVPENDIRLFLDGATDVIELQNVSDDEIVRELDRSWSRDRGLQLTIILLDSKEDQSVRRLAVDSLSDLLVTDDVREFVANRLYSSPMPESADLSGAIAMSKEANAVAVMDFLRGIGIDQPEIARRCAAWASLQSSLFEGEADRAAFRQAAIEAGAFRLFVTERSRSDWALFQLLSHARFRGNARARMVLQRWAAPFRETVANTEFSGRPEDESTRPFLQEDDRQFRRNVSAREAFQQAEKQRDAIKKVLQEGRSELALKFTEQLIRSQRQTSDAEHIAKSLCDLAQFAKSLGSGELQLEFALKAISEAPDDAWSHATLGDAYRQIGEYQKSLDAFSRAGELGDRRAAMMGRAEVLKDLGELQEALTVLEACAEEFQDNVVTLNSEAAALASFGRFREALEAYNDILTENPYEQVTRTGRAQVLRDLGRLEEARAELDGIVRDYPNEFVPRYIRGEVSRESGRLMDALEEARELAAMFPAEVGGKVAYARTLRELGRFDDAIQAYERAMKEHPFDASGAIGLAETYRKGGDMDKARIGYEAVLSRFARVPVARNGLAAVLVASGEYEQALKLLPRALPATQGEWVAYHIRAMALLRGGEFDRARVMLEWGVSESPWLSEREYFRTALASLRIHEGRHQEAIGLVNGIESVEVAPISRVVQMHALGELGDEAGVDAAYEGVPEGSSPVVLKLRDIVANRYSRRHRAAGQHAGGLLQDLLSQECDSLLLAA